MRFVSVMLSALVLCTIPLTASAKVSPEKYAELREDAFGAAQGTIVSAAADALSNVALTFSESSGALADLVRKREDLSSQIEAHHRQYDRTFGDKGSEAAANRLRIQKEENELAMHRAAVDREISEKYPRFSELTRPQPLKSSDVQALLNPDEGLLVIVPTEDGTYLFVVTAERFDWARSALKQSEITKIVKHLRDALDSEQAPAAFDRHEAYRLFEQLIVPLKPLLANKKILFTATSGALQSLPLSVLVTTPPEGDDSNTAALRGTHWLIDDFALVTLPAISSLKSLRCFPAHAGTVVHKGCKGGQQAGAYGATPTLEFVGIGNPVLGKPARVVRGSENYSYYSRGDLAFVDHLRTLESLPGTETELRAVGALFPKNGTVLLLGSQATERQVKTDPNIAKARIVEFATHALIADEKQVIGEPGLVLTPPKTATETDDGLLTASEAAQLKLSADFVVLSACNTARKNGELGADGLSGLARAFLYAGARSLLVSNWTVSDQATPVLMTHVFTAIKQNSNRAMAFRAGVLEMKARGEWVSPRFWAPFILVGESR